MHVHVRKKTHPFTDTTGDKNDFDKLFSLISKD